MSMIIKNTKTELIQEHWLQDIYRLENGTLLTVNKFKQLHWACVDLKKTKKDKIKGIKNCHRIKEDLTYWDEDYKSGQLFLEGHPVDEVESDEYEFKLTSNDGVKGDNDYMLYMTNEIEKIVKIY